MANEAYEVRKRIFSFTDSRLHFNYKCRRCGAVSIPLSIKHATQYEEHEFECPSAHCDTTWSTSRYRLVWRILVAKGCKPVAYPEHLRYSQLRNYLAWLP